MLIAFGPSVKAQDEVGQFLSAGAEDAEFLISGYAKPLANAFGAGLNNGWYNTARPHKLLRFDVTGGASLIFIPSEDQTFSIGQLNHIQPASGTAVDAPTIFGSSDEGPELVVYQEDPFGNNQEITRFNAPSGIGVPYMVVPFSQLSVGLVKKTEVSVRFFPSINVPAGDFDIKLGMFGFGIKHDVLQWFKGADKIPVDVSAFFGYTSFKSEFGIALDPDYPSGSANNPNGGPYDDQRIEFNSSAWTFRVLVSKKLAFFTPYAGVGYNNATTNLNVLGNYPVTVYDLEPSSPTFGQEVVRDISDPVKISAKDASGFVANVGFRLKFLWVLALHADYTLGKYSAATVGLGLNVDF